MGVTDPDIIITAYRTVRDEVELLRKMSWYCIILDEAQRIKNPYTELTRSVKTLPSEVRIALCSMEVENSLGNLWSLLDFTNPGYLGTWQQFTNQFIHPIRLDNDRRRAVFLKKITAPLLLRRRKSDKLDLVDMPDRIEHRQYAPLIAEQAALYQNLAVQGLRAVFDEKDGQRRQAIALKLLIALKQVCNHPYQYLKKGSTIPDLSGKVGLCKLLRCTEFANLLGDVLANVLHGVILL